MARVGAALLGLVTRLAKVKKEPSGMALPQVGARKAQTGNGTPVGRAKALLKAPLLGQGKLGARGLTLTATHLTAPRRLATAIRLARATVDMMPIRHLEPTPAQRRPTREPPRRALGQAMLGGAPMTKAAMV